MEMNQMLELSDNDLKAAGIKTQMVNTEIRLIIFFAVEYEDLQDLREQTPKKDVLFIIGHWNAKVRSRNT